MSDPVIWTQFGAMGLMAWVFYRLYVSQTAKTDRAVETAKKESSEREARMTDRIQELEDYIRQTLVPLVQDCNQALRDTTRAMNRFCDVRDEESRRHKALGQKEHP